MKQKMHYIYRTNYVLILRAIFDIMLLKFSKLISIICNLVTICDILILLIQQVKFYSECQSFLLWKSLMIKSINMKTFFSLFFVIYLLLCSLVFYQMVTAVIDCACLILLGSMLWGLHKESAPSLVIDALKM
jgi:hypothetical protein